ncbi:hypothetical protein GCM10010330_76640 [Streptomyces tendae]|uniref:RICIN domain-containing protein n=1 Tax=Streptomyces tendae TaxID=1932 RepID=UPI001672E22E|nr:RICIN domain-containing protein [Streptomyces tendae]GHB11297.1 hypothetical protein GCM10010330_76640 [Streptomyces tendae]
MSSPHTPRPDGELPKRVRGSGKQVGAKKATSALVPDRDETTADETRISAPAGRVRPTEEAGRDASLPRLTQFSSLSPRAAAGESRGTSTPAAGRQRSGAPGEVRGDGAGEGGPAGGSAKGGITSFFRRRRDKSGREGLRGALGVVGVVGLLAAGAVVLTLALSGQDDAGKHDGGGSVVVGSGGYGPGDVEGLSRSVEPSASASAGMRDQDAKKAKGSAKPSPPASSSTGASDRASAAPGGQATTPVADGEEAPAEPAEPKSVPGVGVFSHASQRCIDIVGSSATPGAALMIQDCSGAASQHWTFPSDGTMRALGLCVQLAGGSTDDGTDLRMGTCDGSAAQRISLNFRHDVVSSLANKCADVRDEGTSNGTRIQLWSCNGHDNQKWSTS